MRSTFSMMIFCLFSFSLLAAEVDQFSKRHLPLEDASPLINKHAREYLAQALEELNQKEQCSLEQKDERKLYNKLEHIFSNHIKGQLVKDMLYTDLYPKNVIPIEESIYKYWTKKNGFLLATRIGKMNSYAIYPEIRVGDVRIGVDKFEHFFAMGARHFREYYFHQYSLEFILNFDYFIEKNGLGGNSWATGVMSYGDMAANMNGIRFWNNILQKHSDLLGAQYNYGPYVLCQDGKWIINPEKELDLRDYIDDSMDEGINCSAFANEKGVEVFKKSLKELGFITSQRDNPCPLEPEKFQALKEKYKLIIDSKKGKTLGDWILNDRGIKVRD